MSQFQSPSHYPRAFFFSFFCYACEEKVDLAVPVYGEVAETLDHCRKIGWQLLYGCPHCGKQNVMWLSADRPVVKGMPLEAKVNPL